nr:SPOR domain-containing protein [uncultured Cohaesibacter sp.]
MSDPNDKKPQSPATNWSDIDRQAREKQGAGQIMEDPLAELDRIVSGDFGQGGSQRGGASVSDDDLRMLEQELIRELRGHQARVEEHATVGYPQDDVDPAEHDASADYAPYGAELPQEEVPEAPRVRSYEPVSEQRAAPRVQAPSPSVERPVERESGLDDWSSLFDDIAPKPAARAAEPARPAPRVEPALSFEDEDDGEPPVATSGSYGQLGRRSSSSAESGQSFFKGLHASRESEPYQAEEDAAPAAPEVNLGAGVAPAAPAAAPRTPIYDARADLGATGAEYGRPQEPVAPRQSARDPMSGFRPSEETQQPATRREPVMPTNWGDYTSRTPLETPSQDYREPSVSEPSYEPTRAYADPRLPHAGERARPQAPVEPAPYAGGYEDSRPSQPEPYDYRRSQAETAPRSVREGRVDPYASFNDPASSPATTAYGGHAPSTAGHAPDVNVAGRSNDYANYGSGPSYRTTAQQTYDQDYAQDAGGYEDPLGTEYGAAETEYGTYSDPTIAQAAAESAPNYGDEEYTTLETAAAMATPQPKRKSRKGLYAAAAAGLVIVVGGVLAWSFGQSGSGSTETPVIEANTDPVKETPEDPGGTVVPNQDQTVYDRIDGTESDEGPTTMMPATETPIDVTANGQTPRVIALPGSESTVSQSSNSEETDSGAVAPKRVRTVVVRPDGTFVTSDQPEATQEQPQVANVDQQMLDATPSEQAMSQTYNTNVNGSQATGVDGAAAQGVIDPNMPLPKSKPAELEQIQSQQASVPQPVAPAPQPVQPVSQAPLVLNPASSPAPQNTAVSSGAGGYTVQVTSQRTPEQAQASYRNIQAQLSSVLGGYEPDIKEADLGARGTYYRVRVGSFADQAGAINFCNSIKAAGGDCLVARK